MFTASALCAILVANNTAQLGTAGIAEMLGRKHKMNTTYRVKVRVESRHYLEPNVGRGAHTASIWRDGDKLRVDVTEAVGEPPPPPGMVRPGGDGERHISCHNCERPGYYLVTSVSPGDPKITQVVGFHKTPAFACFLPESDIDWRYLGLSNNSLSVYGLAEVPKGCQNYLTNPKRVLSRSLIDTKSCLASSLTTPAGQSETYFSVEEGHNPILYSSRHKTDFGEYKSSTEITWLKTPGNHLYPSRIKHSEMKGDKLESDETVRVIDADFHNPIDPVMFTVAGMGLNDGQRIAYPDVPAADQPIWRRPRPAGP